MKYVSITLHVKRLDTVTSCIVAYHIILSLNLGFILNYLTIKLTTCN
jgi:hypothetical protein